VNWSYLLKIKPAIYKVITWTLVLFRKKIFLVLATYWTFSNTLKGGLHLANGSISAGELGNVFVSEAYTKFLGAAPKILEGLKALNNFQLVEGILLVWTGIAAVIMLLYIWKFFREKGQNYSVDGLEYGLVLIIWLLLTSQVHGESLVVNLLNQFYELFTTGIDFLPSKTLNETVNTSLNNSTS
jgi:hypothetical protein